MPLPHEEREARRGAFRRRFPAAPETLPRLNGIWRVPVPSLALALAREACGQV